MNTNQNVYVSLLWCYHLYQCCQYFFEDIDEVEFANLLNLRCNEHIIIIRSKEKYRFCYFLNVLAIKKRFVSTVRDLWLSQILKATNIKMNYFKSHYNDPKKFKKLEPNKIIMAEIEDAINKAKCSK